MLDRMSAYTKGLIGEDRAAEYLQAKGMILLSRRYRTPYGEIDLIMLDGDMITFVEVKSRIGKDKGSGFASITKKKQKRIVQTASIYMAAHQIDKPSRFDAVEITPEAVVFIPNAFDASGIAW